MGPLAGLRVVEAGGIGPAPFAGMVLADLGAEVIRLDRRGGDGRDRRTDLVHRGKRSVGLDLKAEGGRETALALVARADALIEGFRPGVMERLGLGPEDCHARNPGLVYGRITGWGQDGPLAQAAGHDVNYLALTGILGALGPPDRPPSVPLNVVADYGGGAMFLLVGVLAALRERDASGRGQVVDAAMVDGAALLSTIVHGFRARGAWRDARGENLLDGGAPFYATYECACGGHLALGAIEPEFHAELLRRLGLDGDAAFVARAREDWPALRAHLAALFRTRTRAEWCAALEGTDACASPVLSWDEASAHPHNAARGTFVQAGGIPQPGAAPRFSRTPTAPVGTPPPFGNATEAVLRECGLDDDDLARLRETNVI